MKVYSDHNTYTSKNTVVTLGMFDGVHLGHKKLLASVVQQAKETKCRSVVVTFWPHPRIVLGHNADGLAFITTLEEKLKLIEAEGIDDLILLPFTKELASLNAAQFICDVLINQFGMAHLVMGYNHRFGKDRMDDYSEYKTIANNNNFTISKVDAVTLDSYNVSSTIIRDSLSNGDIRLSNKLLGSPFSVTGKVVGGQQLGRTIGFPTANIQVSDTHKIIPKLGVYACNILISGQIYKGMLNIGYRPTVSSAEKRSTIEVHIFDFDADIYKQEVEVIFIERVRDEKKFNGVDELKNQLHIDEQSVRKILIK